jgi:hypothetical protein
MSPTETSPLLDHSQDATGEQGYCSQSTTTSESSSQHVPEQGPNKTSNNDGDSERDAIRKSVWWTLPALAVGIFLSAADQTLVVASYGKIGTEFAALNKTSWIATG